MIEINNIIRFSSDFLSAEEKETAYKDSKELSKKMFNRQKDSSPDKRFRKIYLGICAELIFKHFLELNNIKFEHLGCNSSNSLDADFNIFGENKNILIDIKSSEEKDSFNSLTDFLTNVLNKRNFVCPIDQTNIMKDFVCQIYFYKKEAFLIVFISKNELIQENNIKELVVNKNTKIIQLTHMINLKNGKSFYEFLKGINL